MAERSADAWAWSAFRAAGRRPAKRLGQNFLLDRSILPLMLRAAELEPDDQVLEVGPGLGVLTEALSRSARRVVAVELDEQLVAVLQQRFQESAGVSVVHGDALQLEPCELLEGPYKLVANIPYYITGPLLRHFLAARCQPRVGVLMVQLEVARRMAAAPGTMSLLSLSVQYYARVRVVARVPARAFSPRPKVDSAVVRLEPYRPPDEEADALFFEVVRAGFSTRRKQLRNALANGLGRDKSSVEALLEESGLDGSARAETLCVQDWERLARAWRAQKG